jgi:hypothetical protein
MESGTKTSEFSLTAVSVVLGACMEGAAVVLNQLQANGIDRPWIHSVMIVCGMLLQAASIFGYQKSRTVLKAVEMTNLGPPLATAMKYASTPPAERPTPPDIRPAPLDPS